MKQDLLKSISDNLKSRFTENQVEEVLELGVRSFGALRADCKVKSGKWQVASFGAKPIVS